MLKFVWLNVLITIIFCSHCGPVNDGARQSEISSISVRSITIPDYPIDAKRDLIEISFNASNRFAIQTILCQMVDGNHNKSESFATYHEVKQVYICKLRPLRAVSNSPILLNMEVMATGNVEKIIIPLERIANPTSGSYKGKRNFKEVVLNSNSTTFTDINQTDGKNFNLFNFIKDSFNKLAGYPELKIAIFNIDVVDSFVKVGQIEMSASRKNRSSLVGQFTLKGQLSNLRTIESHLRFDPTDFKNTLGGKTEIANIYSSDINKVCSQHGDEFTCTLADVNYDHDKRRYQVDLPDSASLHIVLFDRVKNETRFESLTGEVFNSGIFRHTHFDGLANTCKNDVVPSVPIMRMQAATIENNYGVENTDGVLFEQVRGDMDNLRVFFKHSNNSDFGDSYYHSKFDRSSCTPAKRAGYYDCSYFFKIPVAQAFENTPIHIKYYGRGCNIGQEVVREYHFSDFNILRKIPVNPKIILDVEVDINIRH